MNPTNLEIHVVFWANGKEQVTCSKCHGLSSFHIYVASK